MEEVEKESGNGKTILGSVFRDLDCLKFNKTREFKRSGAVQDATYLKSQHFRT